MLLQFYLVLEHSHAAFNKGIPYLHDRAKNSPTTHGWSIEDNTFLLDALGDGRPYWLELATSQAYVTSVWTAIGQKFPDK